MRILTRYILGEVVSHALIGAAVFTFVLFTRDLGRILELVVRNSAPLPSVAQVFFFTVPVALTYTIPMGVLVGILIGLSRLSADSEITAMRASGLGVWTFLRIIMIFVVGAWLLALGNSIYLADLTQPSAPRITLAREGILASQGPDTLDLPLVNGSTHETDPKNPDQYQISTFDTTDIPIQIPVAQNSQTPEPPSLGEMKVSELLGKSHSPDPMTQRWALLEYHRRLSLPTACLVLALVGIPLGLSSKRGGKSTGFVLTILLV